VKKLLNEIFSISRNERIGLLCLIIILLIVIAYTAFSSHIYENTEYIKQTTYNFQASIDSSRIDTITKKKKKKKKTKLKKSENSKHHTLTATDLEETKTY